MGDRFYLGYDTSDSEKENEEVIYADQDNQDIDKDENGNPIKVELDKDEIYQIKLEYAIE